MRLISPVKLPKRLALISVKIFLVKMQKLEKAKKQELETETHMKVMAVQEKERLIREIKTMNKDLDEMRDRSSMYEVSGLITC